MVESGRLACAQNGVCMLPLLTADLPGTAGTIKAVPEDFQVVESPLYTACGEGTHVYVEMEKRGLSTIEALHRIARGLGLSLKQIGYAGLKDARAVTRQWISMEHMDPKRIEALEIPGVRVVGMSRHGNKLRLGHLAGNRFTIRVRQLAVEPEEAVRRAEAILEVLVRRGVPNYFGPQRFGNRADGHLLGGAIIGRRGEEFIDLLLGSPDKVEQPAIQAARQWYQEGLYEKAYEAWPVAFHEQRQALRALMRSGGDKGRAFNVIDKRYKRFMISAFQSDLFNKVVAIRMPAIDEVVAGDMAYKHENGACFRVENALAEQERCMRFEISATGPLYGYRMTDATGTAGQIEQAVLAPTQLDREDFRRMGYYRIKGTRRPLRFRPRDVAVEAAADERGQYLELRFELDSGCYATTLLREVTKKSHESRKAGAGEG